MLSIRKNVVHVVTKEKFTGTAHTCHVLTLQVLQELSLHALGLGNWKLRDFPQITTGQQAAKET
jgi:hypothetical protein